MAASTTPIFKLTGPEAAIAVGDVAETAIAAGTGSTLAVTFGGDGSQCDGLQFMCAQTPAMDKGYILIYYYDGTNNFLWGSIKIPTGWNYQSAPLVWKNPAANQVMKATRRFYVGKVNQIGAIHCAALASNY